ncbi:MAG: GNAT family N-acetyltransferase [Rhodospirillales bacterium]|nr:MAG: GNAT family N-acetyltransferase [Rhodospirillales bacterium]
MTGRPCIRSLAAADHAWALELNNAAVPHVSALDAESLAALMRMAGLAAKAELDGAPAGLLIALEPGTAYGSANYRWFCDRYPAFVYIDRVIADPASRGRGVGRALYAHAVEFARARAPLLTCEVNEAPPNPASMRFHERFGFRPLGRQRTEGGAKRVVLLGLGLAET